MRGLFEIFLSPRRIGNGAHGVSFVVLRLALYVVVPVGIIYGALWLSGNLEGFMRGGRF